MTSIHWAARNGSMETVKTLVDNGINIDEWNFSGRTPLFLAAENGNKAIAAYLIDKGANVNCSDFLNNTVLHVSIRNGWADIVESLLKRGASTEVKSRSCGTPMQLAVNFQKIEMVQFLLNAGANVNEISNNGTSLLSDNIHIITSDKKVAIVRLLIGNGAYFRRQDDVRELLVACVFHDVELCSQAIINEFNNKNLPELYNQPMISEILPLMERLGIQNTSHVRNEMLTSVKLEIKRNRYML